ncbi:MAG TPA: hypothetical protein VFQ61_15115 [Polyangiaceae bacterium]|nr:hypothetical protein [Polyangiaceae bacterium]
MDELVNIIVQKTGISESQARTAVETVAGFLKSKLPAPLAAHVDTALSSAGAAAGNLDLGSLAGGLGGLFGKK